MKLMSTVLITGVAGLIGSKLAEWIIEKQPGCKVIGIDNLSGGYRENLHPQVEFYQMDLSSDDLSGIFSKNDIRFVYHLAAYAAEGLSPFIRKFNYSNNVVATANVINNCIQYSVKRLIFTSSMAVYGEGNPPFHEDHVPNPVDPYGIAKYACEMDIRVAGMQHGLDWCIIRPHNVYGENQNIWDKYRNVLGIWMYQKFNGEPFSIFGDGSQIRAFSYIGDILEPLWNAAIEPEASKKIINLGSNRDYTIKEAANLLSEIVGGHEHKHYESRHEVKVAYSSHERAETILKFSDRTSLETGLRNMWEWAKRQPVRQQYVWKEYEMNKGMYSFWKTDKSNEAGD